MTKHDLEMIIVKGKDCIYKLQHMLTIINSGEYVDPFILELWPNEKEILDIIKIIKKKNMRYSLVLGLYDKVNMN